MNGKGKLALWLFLTYVLSALCYLPQILQQGGAAVAEVFLHLKNLFIFVPMLISIAFLLHECSFLNFWRKGVAGLSRKEILVCAIVLLVGFSTTLAYSFFFKTNAYSSTYPSVFALAGTCIYLLCTAFLEEAAWRGFFLRRLAEGRKAGKSLFIGGNGLGVLAYSHVDGPRAARLSTDTAAGLDCSGVGGSGEALSSLPKHFIRRPLSYAFQCVLFSAGMDQLPASALRSCGSRLCSKALNPYLRLKIRFRRVKTHVRISSGKE